MRPENLWSSELKFPDVYTTVYTATLKTIQQPAFRLGQPAKVRVRTCLSEININSFIPIISFIGMDVSASLVISLVISAFL